MAIRVYPIGYLNASSDSRGSWTAGGTATNFFFEPNMGCKSNQNDTTLISEMENHSLVTRKKLPIFRNIMYMYDNIWAKEYEMIDRFYALTNGRADRFYVIDFSQREKAVGFSHADEAPNVIATIPDTHRFNTTVGKSGYWAVAWKPSNASLMIGKMVSINADQAITFTASYGDLKVNSKKGEIFVYPVFEVHFADSLANFEKGEFVPQIDEDDDISGYLMTGNVTFIQYGAG